MFFSIEFGILSRPGILLLDRCFKHRSYVSWLKYLCSGICESPLVSIMSPSRSCHGYCLTPHVQLFVCSGW